MPSNFLLRALMARHLDQWSTIFEYVAKHPDDPEGVTRKIDDWQRSSQADPGITRMYSALISPVFSNSGTSIVRLRAMEAVTYELAGCLVEHAKTGNYPMALTSLDPFTGQPLRLRVQRNQIRVYSFGPDRIDDQGRTEQDPDTHQGFGAGPGAPQNRTDIAAIYPPILRKATLNGF